MHSQPPSSNHSSSSSYLRESAVQSFSQPIYSDQYNSRQKQTNLWHTSTHRNFTYSAPPLRRHRSSVYVPAGGTNKPHPPPLVQHASDDESLRRQVYKNLELYGPASLHQLSEDVGAKDASSLSRLLNRGLRAGHLRSIQRKNKADLYELHKSSSWQPHSHGGNQSKCRRLEPLTPKSLTRIQIARQHLHAARNSGAKVFAHTNCARLLRECTNRGIPRPSFSGKTKHISRLSPEQVRCTGKRNANSFLTVTNQHINLRAKAQVMPTPRVMLLALP